MELVVSLKLRLNEPLHSLEIILIEGFSDQVEHKNALTMGNWTERIGSHHEEHGLDDFFAHGIGKNGSFSNRTAFWKYGK